ncbi:hypothetical protein PTTG_26267 [Puccinia triticina 1-1 BBBD Race 1]|uniref:hAT-like transposase RNase-H fold domain-containing protein n=1 Tax=Puccinia triticina (isolate 1-1 / race 1 (BBBD)) TaxID=630390 RepID=A0A180GVJ4_PUCT1|nr:hypothetical protein PTTG_26267 [Puccinia triticina 1-1 BBBD Race 1]
MASEMYSLIYNNEPPETDKWDPMTMHVRCFCHKLALIVNAGLASLSMKTLPPEKSKELVLGFFPVLGRLVEEDKDTVERVGASGVPSDPVAMPGTVNNDCDSQSDYGNANDELSDTAAAQALAPASKSDLDNEPVAETYANTSKLQGLTTKLDTVIKQITRSAAQRASFNCMANKLGVKVAPLIAGYGIRWNVKYESHRKAIEARDVIDKLFKEDQAQDKTGVFNNVFVKLTSQMEGNQPTGAHVIPKYLELKEQLSGKLDQSEETDPLYPMYYAMLKRVEKYLAEAMCWNSLNPLKRSTTDTLSKPTHKKSCTLVSISDAINTTAQSKPENEQLSQLQNSQVVTNHSLSSLTNRITSPIVDKRISKTS